MGRAGDVAEQIISMWEEHRSRMKEEHNLQPAAGRPPSADLARAASLDGGGYDATLIEK
jgi:hypothetical protein